jgi:Na+(H+)/acetate symporter ActP
VCDSNNFIEQQAYEWCEKIRKDSVYKFLRVEYSGGNSLGLQKQNNHSQGNQTTNRSAIITRIVLEDKDGTVYPVEPNPNGLRFAKGEITFKEYRKLQNRETINFFTIFFVMSACFGGLMFTLVRFFT